MGRGATVAAHSVELNDDSIAATLLSSRILWMEAKRAAFRAQTAKVQEMLRNAGAPKKSCLKTSSNCIIQNAKCNDEIIVCDAMILIRGVLGRRVAPLVEQYRDEVAVCYPDRCFEEARRNLPRIAASRHLDVNELIRLLELLRGPILAVKEELYREEERAATGCIDHDDRNDWHVVAAALLLDCPIWTEDYHFFGLGLRTWTTANIERFLSSD